MQLDIPPDLQPLIDKRVSSGESRNAEEVFRRALEALEAEETWTDEERRVLDEKDRSRAGSSRGRQSVWSRRSAPQTGRPESSACL